MPEGMIEGQTIHVTLTAGASAGQCRPGVVVKMWDVDTVNVQAWLDGTNDTGHGLTELGDSRVWVTSLVYARDARDATHWHWPSDDFPVAEE